MRRLPLALLLWCGCYKTNPDYCDEHTTCAGGLACDRVAQQCVDVSALDDMARRPLVLDKVQAGNPTWDLLGFQLFSATVKPDAVRWMTYSSLGGTRHVLAMSQTGGHDLIPGQPHQGPYDDEMGLAVKQKGYENRSAFLRIEATYPKGLVLIGAFVPRAGSPSGSSPDFADGPIIPNSVFPIKGGHAITLDEKNVFSLSYGKLALDHLPTPRSEDGWSHLFDLTYIQFGGNSASGDYRWTVTATDKTGAGWQVTLGFTIN